MKYLIVHHLSRKDLTRIFSKISVNRETGCWEWIAHRDKGGYGRCDFSKLKLGTSLVARVLFAWVNGPIPKGRGRDIPNLDHIVCNNPPCCNPAHLILSSVKENTLRGNSPTSINSRKTHCKRGHELPVSNGVKRECLICRSEYWKARRNDPAYREQQRNYHHEYYQRRKAA